MIENDMETLRIKNINFKEIDIIKSIFNSLYGKLPIGVALIDSSNGTIYDANNKYLEKMSIDIHMKNIDINTHSHQEDIKNEAEDLDRMNKGEIDIFSLKKRYTRDNDSYIQFKLTIFPLIIEEQKTGFNISVMEDITEKDRELDKIIYSLDHDSLTGLYSRKYINKEFHKLKTENIFPISIILGNVDGLKFFNETFGYLEGDKELIRIGKRISEFLNNSAKVARFSGDEFIIILAGYKEKEINDLINDLNNQFNSINKENDECALSISFGYGLQKSIDSTIVELYKDAAISIFNARHSNRGNIKNNKFKAIIDILLDKDKKDDEHSHKLEEISVKIAQLINLDEEYVNRTINKGF